MTKNMNVFYTEEGYVYLIPNHYAHSIAYIKEVIEYAKTIGLTVPNDDLIKVEVLSGPKYARMLSVEFNSATKPTEGILLTKDSGLWEWLKY